MSSDLAPAQMSRQAAGASGSARPSDPLVELGGLIAARICHDLVSPVGAIANGVDLMREATGSIEEEVELVRQSTERASALLRLLRVTFGRVSDDGPPVERRQIESELRAVIAGRRVVFEVTAIDGPPVAPQAARLAGLMVLCGRHLLGLSGRVELVFSQDSDLPLRVTAEGAKAAITPAAARWLAGALDPLPSSREVELALTPIAARSTGAVLSCVEGDGSITLTARAAG
ncbi:MAG: histidine phosphotransferase family protein [Pseudomonadota bacterium]